MNFHKTINFFFSRHLNFSNTVWIRKKCSNIFFDIYRTCRKTEKNSLNLSFTRLGKKAYIILYWSIKGHNFKGIQRNIAHFLRSDFIFPLNEHNFLFSFLLVFVKLHSLQLNVQNGSFHLVFHLYSFNFSNKLEEFVLFCFGFSAEFDLISIFICFAVFFFLISVT